MVYEEKIVIMWFQSGYKMVILIINNSVQPICAWFNQFCLRFLVLIFNLKLFLAYLWF